MQGAAFRTEAFRTGTVRRLRESLEFRVAFHEGLPVVPPGSDAEPLCAKDLARNKGTGREAERWDAVAVALSLACRYACRSYSFIVSMAAPRLHYEYAKRLHEVAELKRGSGFRLGFGSPFALFVVFFRFADSQHKLLSSFRVVH